MAVSVGADARCGEASRRLPDLRAEIHGKPLAYLELGRDLAEAAPGARGDDRVLRDVVLERPPRRLRARRARDRGPRGRPREGARVRQRPERARDHLRPQRDRGRSTSSPTPTGSPDSARATSCSRPSSSTTRTSSPGSTSRTAPAPSSGSSRSTTTATCSSTRSPTLENVKVVAANIVSNSLGTIGDTRRLADWAHERGAILDLRRRPGRAARPPRRAGARRRLRRRLRPQDARPERHRLPLGPHASSCSRWSRSCSAAT